MTQLQQQHSNTFTQWMSGLPALLVLIILALVLFILAFWYTTSTRITAIETQLAVLSENQHYEPIQNVNIEPERTIKDQQVQTNKQHGELEANMQTVETKPRSISTHSIEVKQTPAGENDASSDFVITQAKSPTFKDGLQSLYRSLELSPERRAELGSGLEDLVKSIWPRYIELSKNPRADASALQQLYCEKAQSILTAQEVVRLGC